MKTSAAATLKTTEREARPIIGRCEDLLDRMQCQVAGVLPGASWLRNGRNIIIFVLV